MIIILASFESQEDAEKVAEKLIDKKLAACVSIFPVTNFYYWKGEKTKAPEFEAFIKTTEDMFKTIEEEIKSLVNYEIPQLIQLDVQTANSDYLTWLKERVK